MADLDVSRFPWTAPFLAQQQAQRRQVIQAVRTCWSVEFQEDVLRSVTIRGFESESRCKELLGRQRRLIASAAKRQ